MKNKISMALACTLVGTAVLSNINLVSAESSATTEETTLGYVEEFDKTQIMSVSISVDPEKWQEMLDNAEAEEYISCDITINGETIKNVGIRPKGNSSLSSIARDGESDRYSFKVKFDEYVDGQTWLGLDKLVLNNNYSDSTSMKEYISYDIMNYIGVDSSLYSYADISVNNETWGLYLALEDVDSGFLERTKNDEGELYKPESDNMVIGNKIINGEMPEGEMPVEGSFITNGNFPVGDESTAVTGNVKIGGEKILSTNGNSVPSGSTEEPVLTEGASGSPVIVRGNGVNATTEGDFIINENVPVGGGSTAVTGNVKIGGEKILSTNGNSVPSGSTEEPVLTDGVATASVNAEDKGEVKTFGGGMGMNGGANGTSLVYTDDEISSYSAIFDNAETKTNEEDHLRVIEALKNLNEGTDLETYVDVDAVLRYLAAHTVVVNLDSYSSNMAHNYYLYENDGQISMIPWDYNMAFGGFQSSNASDVVNFPIDTPVSGVSLEDRPMIGKLLENPEYLETYHQYIQEIVDGYFADGQFEATVDSVDSLISEYVENDPTAFVTYEEYQSAVEEFKELGTLRGESLQGQLDGTVPSTTEGQAEAKDLLVDASTVDMSLLGDSGMGGMRFNIQGDGGMTFNFNGELPAGLENIDMEKMPQIMDIFINAKDGELTAEQKAKLIELGLTEEQIEIILSNNTLMGAEVGFNSKGGVPTMFENVSMDKMPEVMDIFLNVKNGVLTDEQKAKLIEVGLSETEIETMLSQVNGQGGFKVSFGRVQG